MHARHQADFIGQYMIAVNVVELVLNVIMDDIAYDDASTASDIQSRGTDALQTDGRFNNPWRAHLSTRGRYKAGMVKLIDPSRQQCGALVHLFHNGHVDKIDNEFARLVNIAGSVFRDAGALLVNTQHDCGRVTGHNIEATEGRRVYAPLFVHRRNQRNRPRNYAAHQQLIALRIRRCCQIYIHIVVPRLIEPLTGPLRLTARTPSMLRAQLALALQSFIIHIEGPESWRAAVGAFY